MITQLGTKICTAEEYLELELASETRSEYRNGEIIPMTGGTPDHNDIAGNLYILLKPTLKGKNYRTFYTDQRLWIPDRNLYTYPDVMVLEKPLQLQTGRTDTVAAIRAPQFEPFEWVYSHSQLHRNLSTRMRQSRAGN